MIKVQRLPWEGVCLTTAPEIYSALCPLRPCPPYNEYFDVTLLHFFTFLIYLGGGASLNFLFCRSFSCLYFVYIYISYIFSTAFFYLEIIGCSFIPYTCIDVYMIDIFSETFPRCCPSRQKTQAELGLQVPLSRMRSENINV